MACQCLENFSSDILLLKITIASPNTVMRKFSSYLFVLVATFASELFGGEAMSAIRFIPEETSVTRLAFRATSLEEIFATWHDANESAERGRLRKWLAAKGLSMASRRKSASYHLPAYLECDLTGSSPELWCGITFAPDVSGLMSETIATFVSPTTGLEKLLQASLRRANKLFSPMFRLDAVEFKIRKYKTFAPHQYDGKPVVEIEVHGTQGEGGSECRVIYLLFVGEKSDKMSSVLLNSKLRFLPCDSSDESVALRDGYDAILQFSNSVGEIKVRQP